MGIIAKILTAALEYIIAQAMALGIKQYKAMEDEQAIKDEADRDAKALAETTDKDSRVASLKKTMSDTFGD